MAIKEFTVGFSRTINLGNYESVRVEASVNFVVEEDGDLSLEKNDAQIELRRLMEETWKAQFKTSNPLKKDNGK